jgi:hypothetical protein
MNEEMQIPAGAVPKQLRDRLIGARIVTVDNPLPSVTNSVASEEKSTQTQTQTQTVEPPKRPRGRPRGKRIPASPGTVQAKTTPVVTIADINSGAVKGVSSEMVNNDSREVYHLVPGKPDQKVPGYPKPPGYLDNPPQIIKTVRRFVEQGVKLSIPARPRSFTLRA